MFGGCGLENLVDDGLVVEDALDGAVELRSVEVVAHLVGIVPEDIPATERIQVLVHTLNPLRLKRVERRPTLSRRAICQRVVRHYGQGVPTADTMPLVIVCDVPAPPSAKR